MNTHAQGPACKSALSNYDILYTMFESNIWRYRHREHDFSLKSRTHYRRHEEVEDRPSQPRPLCTRDLVNCALVCRVFSDAALTVLWAELPCPWPVWSLLAPPDDLQRAVGHLRAALPSRSGNDRFFGFHPAWCTRIAAKLRRSSAAAMDPLIRLSVDELGDARAEKPVSAKAR